MGREMKRVPLDFSWPLNKVWGGFVNPYSSQSIKCPDCDGSGYAPAAKLFQEQWYGHAIFDPRTYGSEPLALDNPRVLEFARRNVERSPGFYGQGEEAVQREARRLHGRWRGQQWCHHLIQEDVDALLEADRLWDFTREPRTPEQVEIVKAKVAAGENSWLPESNGYRPTAKEVNDWSIGGFGHDAINRGVCIEARCKREGLPYLCARCEGEGDLWPTPEIKAAHEGWQDQQPPTGPGFQLWETTSEGSPISPVFATLDELCAWAADNASTFGSERTTKERWREMLDENFVRHEESGIVFI